MKIKNKSTKKKTDSVLFPLGVLSTGDTNKKARGGFPDPQAPLDPHTARYDEEPQISPDMRFLAGGTRRRRTGGTRRP